VAEGFSKKNGYRGFLKRQNIRLLNPEADHWELAINPLCGQSFHSKNTKQQKDELENHVTITFDGASTAPSSTCSTSALSCSRSQLLGQGKAHPQ